MRIAIVVFIFWTAIFLGMLTSCENVRHKIGISTKPFGKNDTFESSTKLNYSIIFGKVRPKEDDED